MRPSLREYSDAEDRVRESLTLRVGVLPHHTYPGCAEDLEIMRRYYAEHGIPPAGFFACLMWQLRGRA